MYLYQNDRPAPPKKTSEIASMSSVDSDRQVGVGGGGGRTATSEAGLPSPAKIEAGRRQEGVTGGGGRW